MKYLSCAEETGRQEAGPEMNQRITWDGIAGAHCRSVLFDTVWLLPSPRYDIRDNLLIFYLHVLFLDSPTNDPFAPTTPTRHIHCVS